MRCSSCGRERSEDRCDCGAGRMSSRTNGDIGRQVYMPKRKVKPRWLYAGGRLKKVD